MSTANISDESAQAMCDELAKIAVAVGRSEDGTGFDVDWFDLAGEVVGLASRARTDRERVAQLEGLINTPEIEIFLEGTRLEAAHQVERWGEAHDRDKSAENWFWLVGYLAGKALRAAITGDRDKALHHCISSSAALLNWHKAIKRDATGCGAGTDADIKPQERAS